MKKDKKPNPILSELKPYRAQLILGPFFKLVEAILELLIPTLMVYIVDKGVTLHDKSYVLKMAAFMPLIAIVGFFSAMLCQYMASVVSQGFGTRLRNRLFKHILHLSESDADTFGAPTLINRITNDVGTLSQGVAMLIRLAVRAPFICIGSLVMAIILDIELSLVILISLPLLVAAVWIITVKAVPFYRNYQKKLDTVSRISKENLSGVRVIRAFSKSETEQKRFDKECEECTEAAVRASKISSLLSPATSFIMNASLIAVLWFGSVRIDSGAMTGGKIIAYTNYISYMVTALLVVANLVTLFTKAFASYERVLEILEAEPALRSGDVTSGDINAPAIEFRNVTFRYGSDEAVPPAVKELNFSLKRGGILGITGVTGSGKSSIAGLINRMYDVSEGAVFIEGTDVRNWKTDELRKRVGTAGQKSVLYSGTVESNIKAGREYITKDSIERALRIAQAEEFVKERERGAESEITRGGSNFSGGQKQRLGIARAIAGNPDILVFDDALSALDNVTEAKLIKAVTDEMNCTLVIISQRVRCLESADMILVMDDGVCTASGTHSELIRKSEEYRTICALSGYKEDESE